MKKKAAALLLSALLTLALCAACAAGPEEEAPGTGSPDPVLTQDPGASQGPAFDSVYYQDGAFTLPETVPAETAEPCDGFAALNWGDGYGALFDQDLAQYVVQYGVSWGDFMGTANYFFREGALYMGQLVFWPQEDKSELDMYIELRAGLLERFGQPLPAASGMGTLEDVMDTGEGFCGESWSIQDSAGEKVQVSLLFDAAMSQTPGGRVSLTFTSAAA